MAQLIDRPQFVEQGYEVIPLLSPKEVHYLMEAYNVLPTNHNSGFYTSLNHAEKRERKWVDHVVKTLVHSKVQALLPDHEPLTGTFTIKKKGTASDLGLHLDWSVVDETRHNAIGVWIPLCDVNPSNGSFGLLRGSYRFGHTMRGSMMNFIYAPEKGPDILERYAREFEPVRFTINAGTAIIYDMRTAHFSPPNMGGETRVAANLLMISKGATPVHYFRSSDKEIKMLEVSKDFLLENALGQHDVSMASKKLIPIANEDDIEEQHGALTKMEEMTGSDLSLTGRSVGFLDKRINEFNIKRRFKNFKVEQTG